jgi:F0F1-type ATP synthase membrane subunit b/b'
MDLGLDWRQLLTQLISFSCVFFVLWRFAYKPIFAMLQARKEKIAEALADGGGTPENPGGCRRSGEQAD